MKEDKNEGKLRSKTMERLVYTYALIKSLYDQNEDYIDSFWPFVTKIFPKDQTFISLETAKKSVKENSLLEVPTHTLKTILKLTKKSGYIGSSVEQKQHKLTEKGLAYPDTFEADKTGEMQLNSLFDDINQFLNERSISTSAE